MLFYSISRPGANGEPSAVSQWLRGFEAMNKDWETINAMRTDALDRAAHDRHLFTHSNSRLAQGPTVTLKAPEYVLNIRPLLLFARGSAMAWPSLERGGRRNRSGPRRGEKEVASLSRGRENG